MSFPLTAPLIFTEWVWLHYTFSLAAAVKKFVVWSLENISSFVQINLETLLSFDSCNAVFRRPGELINAAQATTEGGN